MPVRICSCTAAKCPIAKPLPVCVLFCHPAAYQGRIPVTFGNCTPRASLGGSCWREQGKDTCICHSEAIYNLWAWFKTYHFFFLAAENIPILLTKESGVYSALVKNPLTHVRDKFAPKDSKESSQSSLACKESLLLLKSILRQNVFSPAQLANSTGWYWVVSRTISLQLLLFTFLFSNHHPTWLYGSCLSSAAQPLPDMEWRKTISWFFPPHASASPGLLPEQHQAQAYHQTVKLQKFSQLTESVET